MKVWLLCILAWTVTYGSFQPCFAQDVRVSRFRQEGVDQWVAKEFSGRTRYKIISLENRRVLQAVARSSASGLYREIRVNIKKYPYLNWQWRVENRLPISDETVKQGDDYAARIYVVINGGVFFWKTKALNYVWSAKPHNQTIWPNAFAGRNAMMVPVRSGADQLGTWYTEKRNVLEDIQKILGEDIEYIDAVAIMSDTDNSGGEVTAYYGDIYFSDK